MLRRSPIHDMENAAKNPVSTDPDWPRFEPIPTYQEAVARILADWEKIPVYPVWGRESAYEFITRCGQVVYIMLLQRYSSMGWSCRVNRILGQDPNRGHLQIESVIDDGILLWRELQPTLKKVRRRLVAIDAEHAL